MGFWDKVKKKANAVASGADFWDNEENAVQRKNYATGRNDVYTPTVQPQKPTQTFFDKARDMVDANSQMDMYKRAKKAEPVMYAEQQKTNGIGRVANNPWQRTTNTVRAAGEGIMESPKAVGEGLAYGFSPDVKAAESAMTMNMNENNRLLLKTQQDLKDPYLDPEKRARKEKLYGYLQKETGNSYKALTDYQNKKIEATDPKRMAAATADLAFTVATVGVGTAGAQGVKAAFKEGAKQGTKNAVKTASKELAKQSAKTAAVSAPSGAFGTMAVNPEASGMDVAKGFAIGGAVGAALPVAGLVAAPVAKAAGKGIVKVTRSGAQATQRAGTKTLDAVDTAKFNMRNENVKAIDNQIAQYQQAYDVEDNPTLRKQINKGISELTSERRKITEGGYLAGSGSKTFKERQAAGDVFEAPGGARFEGSDERLKITGLGDSTSRETTIGELFEHEDLFRDYPQLRNIPITVSRTMKPHEYGGYSPVTKTMTINRNLSTRDKLNTIMHELNHAVDDIEKFSGGGNPNHPKIANIVKERMKAGDVMDPAKVRSLKRKLSAERSNIDGDTYTPAQKSAAIERSNAIRKELQAEMNKKTERRVRFEAYEDLYGETTSRTVGNRVGMTDADRAKRPFMADLDTSDPKKLIVTENDGTKYGNAVETDVTPNIPEVTDPNAPPARKEWIHPAVQEGAPLPGGRKVTVGRPRTKNPQYKSPEVTESVAPPKYAPVQVENGLRTQTSTAFLDKDMPLIKVLKRMEKATGKTGLVDRFLMDSGLQSRANSLANYKMATSEELKAAMQGLGRRQLKEFNEYAGARAELTMANRNMKTSRPIDQLQKIVDDMGEEYGERFTNLNKFYKERAKDLYDAGIIDKAKYKQFTESDDYIRIQRDFDELVGRSSGTGNSYSFGKSLTSFKRKGSERELLPTDQVTFEYTQQIQKEIQRNRTSSNLIDTLSEFGMTRKLTTKEAVNKNTIKRVVNGKVEIFEVDPILKEVIDNIRPYSLNGLERIIGAPARVFRAGTTALSAPFSAANYLRDQAGSAINSTDVMATHISHPQNIFTGLWEAGKDFGIGNNNDDMWKKFIAHAGDTTQYDLTRNVRDTRMLSRELRNGQAGRAANAILHPIRTLEDLNSITEKATRFQNFKGMYKKTLDETGDEDMAMQKATIAAWQNSVDFNRAGTIGRFFNLLIPYFNASIQGTRQMGRAFTRSKTAAVATTAKAIGIAGMPLYAATAWNLSDPERKEVYNNLDDYEKENNVIFVMPWTNQDSSGSYDVLKFPLPPGYNKIVGPGRRAMESFANKEPQDFTAMAGDLIQSMAGPVQVDSPGQALASITPQGLKPSIQQGANKDFFTDKPIVQDFIDKATDADGNPIAEELKATDYTSGTASLIGKKIGQSPIRVEKFLKDTFGSVGQYTTNASDQVLAGKIPVVTSLTGVGTGLKVVPEERIGGKNPLEDITRRFTKASGKENFQATEGSKYYRDVQEVFKGRTGNSVNRWEAAHPSKTNFLGDEINQKSIVSGGVKAGLYLEDPEVFDMDKQLDAKARKRGKPGNPLFDLDANQRQTILSMQAQKNFNPGDKAQIDVIEKQNPWIKDYTKAQSAFYDKIKADRDKSNAAKRAKGEEVTDTATDRDPNGIPRPEPSDEINRLFEVAGQITDKKMKSDFYKQNPQLTEYLGKNEQYNRAKRAYLGLPQLDRFPEDAGMKKLEEQFFTITDKKSKRAFMESNPALSDYWLKKNLYQLNEAGARARFEGEELGEDSVKDIMSIASKLKSAGGGGGGYGDGGGSNYGGRSYESSKSASAPTAPKVKVSGTIAIKRNKSTPGKILVKRGGRI